MITPQKEEALRQAMAAQGLLEADIDEQFIRSSGKGGQHVNKVSTCVQLLHRPTGIQIKCQADRSQAVNRFLARRMLLDRYKAEILGQKTEAEMKAWKIRKQKRRRSRRAKEKTLEYKHQRSELKQNRKSVRDWHN